MRSFLLAALIALAALFSACDDGGGGGEADTDTDTDTDSDTDTAVDDHWDWESAVIPGAFTGHNSSVRVWGVSDDQAALCAGNMVDGTGGILWFEEGELTVEETGFVCEGTHGAPGGDVWAFGYVDQTFEPILYRRGTGGWTLDTVEGADTSCSYLAMYGGATGDPTLVGYCGGDRMTWVIDGVGSWAIGEEPVPGYDQLSSIRGAFSAGGEAVFYGDGVVLADGTDLGFPQEETWWSGGTATAHIVALGTDGVLSYDGSAWETSVECPVQIPDAEYNSCWRTGTLGVLSGELYLGGGRGGSANENVDDWRLHRWYEGEIYEILEPCGGAEPRCGVQDMSIGGATLFVVAGDPQTVLMWHSVPDED